MSWAAVNRAPIQRAIEAVADLFEVPVEAILSDRRSHAFVRQVAYHVARRTSPASYPAIGRVFARDHATVMHGDRLVQAAMADDPAFRQVVDGLVQELRAA